MSSEIRLLVLSNGHGEDQVAIRIVRQLQALAHPPEIMALPIVGEGQVYRHAQIPILDAVQAMPSGGFIYMDAQQTLRDLQGGLGQLTWRQIQAVRRWATGGGQILAVGDIVPLLFAWWSGADYAFVGTAKSDYYLRDRKGHPLPNTGHPWWLSRSVYLPWERWLMQRPQCRAVCPRDPLTAQILQEWPIPVFDLGNPMMDDLAPTGTLRLDDVLEPRDLTVLLLPGSRAPEAHANWQLILAAIAPLVGQNLLCLAAIAPGLDLAPMQRALAAQGWQQQTHWKKEQATLVLAPGLFNDCVAQADVAIALAGTATEQCVGMGVPVITFPGPGPQFTPAFAEAQTRLLGDAVVMVPAPEHVATALQKRQPLAKQPLPNPRMGAPGAAQRIAKCLVQHLLTELKATL